MLSIHCMRGRERSKDGGRTVVIECAYTCMCTLLPCKDVEGAYCVNVNVLLLVCVFAMLPRMLQCALSPDDDTSAPSTEPLRP